MARAALLLPRDEFYMPGPSFELILSATDLGCSATAAECFFAPLGRGRRKHADISYRGDARRILMNILP